MSRREWGLGAFVLAARCLAGCAPSAPACAVDYPSAPASATDVVRVCSRAPAGGDGSPEHPFSTIQEAIDRVRSGGAVLVAPGDYRENLRIEKPVSVIGAAQGPDPDDAQVIVEAPAPHAITIARGTGDVLLRSLNVQRPIAVGVWVQGDAEATLESSVVAGTLADGDGRYGYGALATDHGTILLHRTAIIGSALHGLVVHGGQGGRTEASVIDGKCVIERNEGAGIHVTSGARAAIGDQASIQENLDGIQIHAAAATIGDNTIDGNKRIGALFDAALPSSTLTDNTLRDNGQYGYVIQHHGAWSPAPSGNTFGHNGKGDSMVVGDDDLPFDVPAVDVPPAP